MVKNRNEPVGVVQVAEVMAALLGKSVEEVLEVTKKNGMELIGREDE